MIHLLQYQFIQYAFLSGTLTAIICAIVGYFVVIRSQAFAAESFTEIGFAGATGAPLLGLSSLVGTFIASILAAIGIATIGKRIQGRDVEVGMVLSFAMGLGVLFLKLYTTNASETVSILFGSILSVTTSDVIINFVTSLFTLFVLIFIFRPLLFSSIDPQVALARGIPVRALSVIFMILVSITIAEAILVVGVLLAFSLLIAPAATALHLSRRPLLTILIAICFGVLSTWAGLLLAFYLHGPVSFFIAGLSSVGYLLITQIMHRVEPGIFVPFYRPVTEKKS